MHETAAPLITGEDPGGIGAIARSLTGYVGWGGSGAETRGRSAIDIALWDLLGQTAGLPLSALLGGAVRTSAHIYNTCAGYRYVRTGASQTLTTGDSRAAKTRALRGFDGFLTRPGALAEPARQDPGDEDLALTVRRDDRRHLCRFKTSNADCGRCARSAPVGEMDDDQVAWPCSQSRRSASRRRAMRSSHAGTDPLQPTTSASRSWRLARRRPWPWGRPWPALRTSGACASTAPQGSSCSTRAGAEV